MDDIKQAVIAYLDSMPLYSRINYPELVEAVRVLNNPAWRTELVDAIAHDVVKSREDFMVQRGRGVVKWRRA